MADAEHEYIDLIFRSSQKYASWDPEIPVEVGDWGRITGGSTSLAFWRHGGGTFLKEGNIYTDEDGKADEFAIPCPKEHGTDSTQRMTWVASNNAVECDLGAPIGG